MSTQQIPDKELLEIYSSSERIRQCDERFRTMLTSGQIAIAYYSPRGQEIVATAMCQHLDNNDYMVASYRGLHEHLAKGTPLKELWAEFCGRATGTCKGKGGPMHITHAESGVMVTTGIIGGGLPIANGLALASVMRDEGRVTVVSFGDGASNIGAFHEALNLASVWKLPVIFLCTNNRYAECTPFSEGTSVASIADRAASYSMAGVSVDGNDPEAMWLAARDAVARARAGEGPTLLEAHSFRFMGHYFGDPGSYIPQEEYDEAVANDPVPKLRSTLLERGITTEEELRKLEQQFAAEIDEAVEFAMSSPLPDADQVLRDVYKDEVA